MNVSNNNIREDSIKVKMSLMDWTTASTKHSSVLYKSYEPRWVYY